MWRRLVIAILSVLVATTATTVVGQPQTTPWRPTVEQEKAATKAAEDYLAARDRGDSAKAYAFLAPGNAELIKPADYAKALNEFNAQAGAPKVRRLVHFEWAQDPDGAPPGVYAAIDVASRFEGVDRHCGYLVFQQAKGGGAFRLMREESNFISNADAQVIAKQKGQQEVERLWADLSVNCPNYPGLAALGATPPPLPEQPAPDGSPSVAATLAALKAKAGVKFEIQNGWTVASEQQSFTFWSFSPVGDPSYPAVVRRQIVKDKSGTSLHMEVHCEASKAACDELVRQFERLNAQMTAELKNH